MFDLKPGLSVAVGLIAHLAVFAVSVSLARAPSVPAVGWLLCYLLGAAFLLAGLWFPRLRLTMSQSLQLAGYAALLAILFWGANEALDLLGDSVRARRLPRELRSSLPLHFVLAPGVASVGAGAFVAAVVRALGQRYASSAGTASDQ